MSLGLYENGGIFTLILNVIVFSIIAAGLYLGIKGLKDNN